VGLVDASLAVITSGWLRIGVRAPGKTDGGFPDILSAHGLVLAFALCRCCRAGKNMKQSCFIDDSCFFRKLSDAMRVATKD
jgi:hypothetical protein